jgi:hypothetical protein
MLLGNVPFDLFWSVTDVDLREPKREKSEQEPNEKSEN